MQQLKTVVEGFKINCLQTTNCTLGLSWHTSMSQSLH